MITRYITFKTCLVSNLICLQRFASRTVIVFRLVFFYMVLTVVCHCSQAQAPDDLSVRRGDWIYADLANQTVDGWLWAYAPKTRKYGFIPKAYARPPAMTSL